MVLKWVRTHFFYCEDTHKNFRGVKIMADNYIKELEGLIEDRLNNHNVELVDIEYRMENKNRILRIFIDHNDGVDLKLCTDITKLVKNIIDENNIYYDNLEVSSPGLDRIIKKDKNPARFISQQVRVQTLKSYPGPKKIIGVLTEVNDDIITVANDTDNYQIQWDVITSLRLHSDYN